MLEDSGNFDIAPLLMLAARTQMAQMMKRLAVKGFDGLNDGLRTDRVTLTIPANSC